MIYFISDTHFFHFNIIRLANRPFKDLTEMHEEMIKRWNEKVKPNDIVVHAGDFAMASKDNMREILSRLNGYKILVKGNHDSSRKRMLDSGFDEVHKHWYDDEIFVFHYPTYNKNMSPFYKELYDKCKIFVYGHVHNNPHDKIKKGFNVSAEVLNYYPISKDELIEHFTPFYKKLWKKVTK